jgi:hypothetical protein
MSARLLPAWEISAALVTAQDTRVVDAFYRAYQPVVSAESDYFVATIPAHGPRRAESWASGKGQSLADFLCALATHTAFPAQEAA